jgi:hypothetical protein
VCVCAYVRACVRARIQYFHFGHSICYHSIDVFSYVLPVAHYLFSWSFFQCFQFCKYLLVLTIVHLQQAEFKRIVSPLKYQTRCLAAFPDQQGFLVCITPHFFYIFECLYVFNKSYLLSSFYLWKCYPTLPNRALLFNISGRTFSL